MTRYDKSRIKILSGGNEATDINLNDITMEGHNMSNIVLNEQFVKLFKADASADTKSLKTRGALLTYCIDAGIDFTKETLSPEQLKELKGLIPLRFPPEARALLKLGAVKAEDKIAAGWDGTKFNSQGRAKNWKFWNNEIGNVLRTLFKGVKRRKQTAARVASGGNTTRTLPERLNEELNALFNAVIAADADKLPDSFDVDTVLKNFKTLSKSAGFTLVRTAK